MLVMACAGARGEWAGGGSAGKYAPTLKNGRCHRCVGSHNCLQANELHAGIATFRYSETMSWRSGWVVLAALFALGAMALAVPDRRDPTPPDAPAPRSEERRV